MYVSYNDNYNFGHLTDKIEYEFTQLTWALATSVQSLKTGSDGFEPERLQRG